MAFKHGAYTSEVETALTAAPAVDSALPYVVGASVASFGPRVISSWRQFVEYSGIDESVDTIPGDDGWHKLSLVSFAYLWFKLCGRGDCILRGIESADGVLPLGEISSALNDIDTVYERTRRLPSVICVPYFAGDSAVWSLMRAKAEQYGGRFKAVALGDIQCTEHALEGVDPVVISDAADAAAAKTLSSESLTLFWPYIGVGDMRFDLSSACAAVMNRVDALNGDLPFVSPSNNNCYATGVYTMPDEVVSEDFSGCTVNALGRVVKSNSQFLTAAYSDSTASVSSAENAEAVFVRADEYDVPFTENHGLAGTGIEIYLTFPEDVPNGTQLRIHGTVSDGSTTAQVDQTYVVGAEEAHKIRILVPDISSNVVVDLHANDLEECWHVSGITVTPFTSRVSRTVPKEAALFLSREEINATLGANGVVSALNTADGWVIWGNNTTAFPGRSDVKDIFLSVRRTFNYVQNAFQIFAQSRVDAPLNRRQLEGVVNSFNQVLASLQGFGALNSASVALDDERNTTAQLLAGVVYFRIRISPPPPMQVIEGVFEYDVVGFEASIA